MNAAVQRKPRREVRVQTDFFVTLLVKSEGEESMQAAFAENISDHGLRIRTRSGLDPGQRVYVFSTNTGVKFGVCRVVWGNRLERDQGVEAGLEILR